MTMMSFSITKRRLRNNSCLKCVKIFIYLYLYLVIKKIFFFNFVSIYKYI